MSHLADWASVAVTLALGVAGFAVAGNIRRDVKLRLAERRLAAYERLWALMRPASPYADPLDEHGRQLLQGAFTDWYFAHGDGMLLERVSRNVYFETKDNLTRPLGLLTPMESRARIAELEPSDRQRARGMLAQRQLSLLRTQLKSDLAVFGTPYGPALGPEDRAFLRHCGVNIQQQPWRETTTIDPTT
ncbi:hypothetical protein OG864_00725 [Streptomyces sp. NBC_00124]|uniref:hypothetical protein n=1 Tax=Streptomyces sp. NBC_00124 TaxID=2975662 RepID=UPI002255EC2B|nr:hypothetical protein [Streptomyces sp. NBC_00124]MCX5357307.1 hypothetical protein [Streptomyces sp. NBC_00124]